MIRKFFLLFLLGYSCTEKAEITGLWELYQMDVAMIPKGFNPTYLKIEPDGSFSVSKEEGDVAGLYQLNKKLLTLASNDQKWFNRSWKIVATEEELVFNDVRNGFRGAQMRFKKIDRFPAFEEFIEKLSGSWELYKIEEKGQEKRISNTYLTIEKDRFLIAENEKTIEEGKINIDSRHHKITFENMEVTWDVRFVWDDLRLENEEMGLMYRLRKF